MNKEQPMKKKWNIRRFIEDTVLHILLVLLALFMLLPFVWMLSTSFKPVNEVFQSPPQLISPNGSFDAYITLFQEKDFARNVWNTFLIASAATLLRLFFCALGGFGFAKYRFLGKGILFGFVLATLVIPFGIMLIPLYVIMLKLNWIDTFWPLIIPGAANAFGIFFMNQYISTVSDELLDAARMDGANEFAIFWRVILPIVSPGLVSLGLIFFMGSWNDFLFPLVILKSPANFTLPLSIRSLISGGLGRPVYNLQMAGSVVSILPLLVIFLVFQRRFIDGITAGAVKS
jgi:ABC-type glycerol-3-phosphate transport system permease component